VRPPNPPGLPEPDDPEPDPEAEIALVVGCVNSEVSLLVTAGLDAAPVLEETPVALSLDVVAAAVDAVPPDPVTERLTVTPNSAHKSTPSSAAIYASS